MGDENGQSYRSNGYRSVRARLRADVGTWLIENAGYFEKSPPGTVNLWTMLTDDAFEAEPDETDRYFPRAPNGERGEWERLRRIIDAFENRRKAQ